ncbi:MULTISPECIES: hypothetical protein [unclassified Aeromicrobium]|jgi:hypothetical protein|uniref:hypothetical protein n=1 Tax=unclassified Aeromicrobium TaxID=2633570 RepID=UPI00396AF893
MSVRSVRQAMSAMGLGGTGDLSVMRDVLGFWRGTPPPDPATGSPVQVTLGEAFTALERKHVHLNLIEVGFDAASVTLAEADERVDYAVHRIRRIYADASLGLGRVQYFWIDVPAADGYEDIGSESEADDLSDDWSVPNDGIDMFLVANISDDFVGISPVPGDCGKGGKSDGLVGGEVGRAAEGFSRTAAHELGHFLDLSHNHGDTCPTATSARENLMAQTRCAVSARSSVLLTSGQGSTVRGRCQTRAGQ